MLTHRDAGAVDADVAQPQDALSVSQHRDFDIVGRPLRHCLVYAALHTR